MVLLGLIIFGNIENLVLASQGAVTLVNPWILGGLGLLMVIIWLALGIFGTKVAIKYADYIEFGWWISYYIYFRSSIYV